MPLCFGALGSVRASSAPHCEYCAAVVQIFWPVMRQPPSTLVALVVRPARSEPAPGSENSWHQIISPRNVGGRNRCCCSSVPNATIDGMIHAAMPICGRLTWPAANSWAMMICSIGLGRPAPRLGQVRLHPAALGDRGVALRAARNRLERGHFRADLLAQLLGVRVEVDVELAHAGRGRDVDDLLRVVGGAAEAGRKHERAPVVDVGVVLPGEADTAVHLDAVLGAALRGDGCQRRRHRGRELESAVLRAVFVRLVDGARGIPDGRGGALGVGDHLGALVLDGLELTDRPAELLADLGVCRRGVGGPPRDADGLRRQQRRHQRTGEGPAQVAQHAVVADLDGVRADMGDAAAAGRRCWTGSISSWSASSTTHSSPLSIATGQHQNRGLCGRGYRPHLAADDQAIAVPGGGQPGVDGVRGDHVAGGQVVRAAWLRGRGRRSARWRWPTGRTDRAPRRSRTRRARSRVRGCRTPVRQRLRTGARPAGPARRRPSSTAAGSGSASRAPRAERPTAPPAPPGTEPNRPGRCAQE